jgi:hypothetical protein
MRYLIFLLILILFSGSPATANQNFVSDEIAASFDIPQGWAITDLGSNQVILAHDSLSGVGIMISRNPIAPENAIGSIEDMETALLGFFRDIDIQNYAGDSLAYTLQADRAEFELMYRGNSQNNSAPDIINILKGIIIRARDGRQWFYLFQASAPEQYQNHLIAGLETVANSFKVKFLSAPRLYRRNTLTPHLLILLILALTAFFYTRNRRIQKSRNPLGLDSGSFWRCVACGKVNHIELSRCRRCGHDREKVGSINTENKQS